MTNDDPGGSTPELSAEQFKQALPKNEIEVKMGKSEKVQ